MLPKPLSQSDVSDRYSRQQTAGRFSCQDTIQYTTYCQQQTARSILSCQSTSLLLTAFALLRNTESRHPYPGSSQATRCPRPRIRPCTNGISSASCLCAQAEFLAPP